MSSEISNAPFILNLECDMYANDANTIQEALCFFLDEKRGHEISFLQFPQNYDNITKNDLYACTLSVINNVGNPRSIALFSEISNHMDYLVE